MRIDTWTRIKPSSLVVLISILISSAALCDPVRGDGRLSLYYDARKDSLNITFRDTRGKVIPAAEEKIGWFLRSPDGEVRAIDIRVIDLMDAIQDHFQEPVVEIISGYRSPAYNRGLKETGHAVANESLHLQGMAIDIHLDSVTEEAVRDYAQSLKQGGVGWYPQNDFVHVDVGPVRTWGHAETRRKWVGLQGSTNHLIIRSDVNRYFYHEPLRITIRPGPTTGDFTLDLSKMERSDPTHGKWVLGRFDRGTWKTAYTGTKIGTDATVQIPASTLDLLARGRYRFCLGDSFSNEFYLKN